MRRNWRKRMMLGTMAILVGAAIFLNWKYTEPPAEQADGKILGEALLVSSSEEPTDSESDVYTGSDYFASARLTRQQARDSAMNLLEQAAEKEDPAGSAGSEASRGIQALAACTLTEARIENLVTAKGYRDCVAFVSDDAVSVVVASDSGELSEEDVAKITDIAATETGCPVGSIRIMAAD